MGRIGKIAGFAALIVIAAGAAVGGKWYHVTAMEPIDAKRGVYGMEGLEIWIDLNARMPDFARVWACDTLLKREAEAMGGANSLRKPYSCSDDFAAQRAQAPQPMVDTVIDSNVQAALAQAPAATEAQKATFGTCVKAAFAAAVPADRQQAANDNDSTALQEVVLAANAAARDCLKDLKG